MSTIKATAIVVRTSDWSETSRIATFFTREFGKVRALAKGGRRLRSNFEVALDLLTVCSIVLIPKNSGLDLLTEARVEERFTGLRSNLKSLYAGYYIAELLGEGTQERDPHPALFDQALAVLRDLNEPRDDGSAQTQRFELAWLHELGYRPRFDSCAACGSVDGLATSECFVFSPTAGGLLCAKCALSQRDQRPLSRAALERLRELDEPGEWKRGPQDPGPPLVNVELRQLLGHYVSFVLGRRPRLLAYLE